MTPTSLEALLQRPDIWQSARRQRRHMGVSTGFSRLDDCLHLGGWPPASLVEILQQGEGIGELQLLLPTLARLSSAGHHCLLLSPPHIPYPPGLEAAGVCIDKLLVIDSNKPLEQLWCAEQALRSGATACLLAWFGSQKLQTAHLRKLLLAAKQSDTLVFFHRHASMAQQPSPASLRLQINSHDAEQLELQILKQPGGWSGQVTTVQRPEAWLKTSRWHLPLALQSPRRHRQASLAKPGRQAANNMLPGNDAAIGQL